METIEVLNQRLVDYYGLDSDTGKPIFRIVWANDELEKRLVHTLDSGINLLYPVVKEMKKYPYLKDMHVLERLVIVPDANKLDLPTYKMSYEPVWTYCNDKREPVPPIWNATKFVVDTLYAALGKKSLRKYIESEKETTKEGREEKINELQRELFENETDVCDALRYKEGIVVPTSYEKNNAKTDYNSTENTQGTVNSLPKNEGR